MPEPGAPRGKHIVLSVSALVVAAACGVEDRVISRGSSGGNTALTTAIARFSLAACDRFQACAPTFIRTAYGTYDRCVERTKLMNTWIAELPDVLQSADFFMDCATAWNNVSCGELFSPVPPTACKEVGTRPIGQQCNFGAQCTTGFCKQTGYQCGLCMDPPAQGSSCQLDGDCAEGQWCMPDKTCRAPGALNQPCSTNLRCRTDLTCSGGVCVTPPSTVGASCDGATGLYCDFYSKGLYCSSAKTCAEAIAKAANQPCAEAGSYCEMNGSCSTAGTCIARAGDTGGACDADKGPYCEWPALCVAGSCQLPTDAGLCAR